MKKRIIKIFACALALSMLCGCGDWEGAVEKLDSVLVGNVRDSAPSFWEIEYVRPDIEAFQADVESLKQALEGGSFSEVQDYIDKCYQHYYNFDTMYTVSNIRSCINMSDKFYGEEYAWCSNWYPTVSQLMDKMFYACGASAMAGRIEEEILWEGFAQEYAPGGSSALSSEVVALMEKESQLLNEYRTITALPGIELKDGTEVDYDSAMSETQDEKYRELTLSYYEKYNQDFADIYIELVKTRNQLAQALGFQDYEHMQYYFYFERDYSPEDAAAYIADIREYMVPFYVEYMETRPYENIVYESADERKLISAVKSAAHNMGSTVEEAFDFMIDGDFYDISLSAGKAPMSFQTYISSYEAPYLFINPVGDIEDILVFSHEFGHFLDAYVNYNAYETVDVAEIFSQAMEYLMLFYYGDALSEQEFETLADIKILDTLEMYVQQASFAEFESIVYSTDPELLSADFLNALSLQLAIDYGYYDGENEEYFAMSWCDIVHFFEMPFYVITYPISNDAAMQIFEQEITKAGKGLQTYLEMLPRDYESFVETITAAGLQSPFSTGRIEQVVRDMDLILDYSDKAA